jgi:hypothetical protein
MSQPELVLLQIYATRQEAEIIQSLLRSAGIESIILADDAGGMYAFPGRAGFSGAPILVRPSDLHAAQQIANGQI